MGDDDATAARRELRTVTRRGGRWWWLDLAQCAVCGQWWLDAQEERIYDVWVMRKVREADAQRIVDGDGVWPSTLDRYVTLLRAAQTEGRRVSWPDPAVGGLFRCCVTRSSRFVLRTQAFHSSKRRRSYA